MCHNFCQFQFQWKFNCFFFQLSACKRNKMKWNVSRRKEFCVIEFYFFYYWWTIICLVLWQWRLIHLAQVFKSVFSHSLFLRFRLFVLFYAVVVLKIETKITVFVCHRVINYTLVALFRFDFTIKMKNNEMYKQNDCNKFAWTKKKIMKYFEWHAAIVNIQRKLCQRFWFKWQRNNIKFIWALPMYSETLLSFWCTQFSFLFPNNTTTISFVYDSLCKCSHLKFRYSMILYSK